MRNFIYFNWISFFIILLTNEYIFFIQFSQVLYAHISVAVDIVVAATCKKANNSNMHASIVADDDTDGMQ